MGKSCDDASRHAAANWSDWLGDGRERLGYNGWSAWSWCGLEDDDDFTASDMCCACGGGELSANGSKSRAAWLASDVVDFSVPGRIPYNAYRLPDGTKVGWQKYEDPKKGLASCFVTADFGYPYDQFKRCPSVCDDANGFGSPASVWNRKHWEWLTKKGRPLTSYDTGDQVWEYRTAWLGLTDILEEGKWQWMNGYMGKPANEGKPAYTQWLGNSPDVRKRLSLCVSAVPTNSCARVVSPRRTTTTARIVS